MDRIVLVELIEGEAKKLSPMGKELWEEMEALVELTPEDESALSERAEITTRMVELPLDDQHALARLMALAEGLYASDYAEKRGEAGDRHRGQAVPRRRRSPGSGRASSGHLCARSSGEYLSNRVARCMAHRTGAEPKSRLSPGRIG
jgi:hypothetical protein